MAGALVTRIARKEFTEFVRDGRSRWAAVIVLCCSSYVGWRRWWKRIALGHADLERIYREHMHD